MNKETELALEALRDMEEEIYNCTVKITNVVNSGLIKDPDYLARLVACLQPQADLLTCSQVFVEVIKVSQLA